MGKKNNDIFDDILDGLGATFEVIGRAAVEAERRNQRELQRREDRIEAERRIIEEEKEHAALDRMSDQLSKAYIRQFQEESLDSGKLRLARALVKADTKIDELTLLEIARTFTMSSSRSEFMRNYYPELLKRY